MNKTLLAIAAVAVCSMVPAQVPSSFAKTQSLTATVSTVYGGPNSSLEYIGEPMQRMIDAAHTFRDAVRTLAAQPAGPHRDETVHAAIKALKDAQNAMAMERLENASMNLQRSVRAIGSANPGTNRDLAIESAREALGAAQDAMNDLPMKSSS